jgi:cyclohexanone monooxygenase
MTESGGLDAVVVGAGFAGMYMLHRLRGMGLTARVFDAASGVGGTWYWNRYPGARCDVESMEYSYQFDPDLQQEWVWSERYATQPEILGYANHVADRFDLRRDMQFDTRVDSAVFDEATGRWTVSTSDGRTWSPRFVIMGTGCLSSTNLPQFEGIDTFAGPTYHTGKWPHEGVDFTGMRVGIIGTGSSAIQSIPIIAEQAADLTVFQRTANYSVPAWNGPLDADEVREIKANYAEFRAANSLMPGAFGSRVPRGETSALEATPEEIEADLEARWARGGLTFLAGFNDFMLNGDANEIAAEFVRNKIRSIVKDPEVAELLCPHHVIGCKRLCVDTGYYATFNRPNVHLVDVSTHPIERLTPKGLITNGTEYEFDAIVFATGFDAMTGTLLRIDVRGVGGVTLQEAWSAGPRTYLGLNVHGFPNFFTISGPGSPSVLTNMMVSIEQHVRWIADCIAYLDAHGKRQIEATEQAQTEWVDFVNAVAGMTLLNNCNSWYLGANVPGKTRVFMPLPGFPTYVDVCNDVVANDYRGFVLT